MSHFLSLSGPESISGSFPVWLQSWRCPRVNHETIDTPSMVRVPWALQRTARIKMEWMSFQAPEWVVFWPRRTFPVLPSTSQNSVLLLHMNALKKTHIKRNVHSYKRCVIWCKACPPEQLQQEYLTPCAFVHAIKICWLLSVFFFFFLLLPFKFSQVC